ncbi:hypothetical protein BV22DRAFT_1025551, partial [Leucogyrophana mollusca]
SALQDWLPHRDVYLDELLRHDGRGSCLGDERCRECKTEVGIFKCLDCASCWKYCRPCVLIRHSLLPFHRLERWTGSFFAKVTLQEVGHVVHLGHSGAPCASVSDAVKNFVVADTSGIHTITVKFCACPGAAPRRIQLLRARLLPATVYRPKSAFTFDVLRTFQLENLQGKISAYDFFSALMHKSDNDRYEQFLTAIRIWRHLKIIKRAGRGHDACGIEATQPGQCAVECPACPQPSRNLPDNWERAPPSTKWLYTMTRTTDANFRLKLKDKKVNVDTVLGDGWAHWVPDAPYNQYIKQHGHQAEARPNLCESELRAVDHANSKRSTGYKATGVGGTLCRHTLVCKNGLGDLQKGERYANMDFIVFFSLIGYAILPLLFSYDIACQWWRNILTRMSQLPAYMQIGQSRLKAARVVIPKFHIYGHGILCKLLYSLNFLRYSAWTDGENVERWWAHINPLSMSTKEMSPWSRRDTIDDHACSWNWHKTTGFGSGLHVQLKQALEMEAKHQDLFEKLTSTFAPALVAKWEESVTRWEADPKAPNPYEEPLSGTTLVDVRLELANEEAAEAARGVITPHETTSSSWLIAGLDLEDQQRNIVILANRKNRTTLQDATLQEKRNTLRHRIMMWCEVQSVYMPGVERLREEDRSHGAVNPELIPLFLPSSLPSPLWLALLEKEKRLRLAQAHDALAELRRLLKISSALRHYKKNQVSGVGQRANTRARALISRFMDKTNFCADRYRAARSSLLTLDPNGPWTAILKVLQEDDVKGPHRNEDDPGEGTRELTWIWLVPRTEHTGDNEVNEGLRVEWAKSRARAQRWKEESQLLVEEMRRVLCFFHWKAGWWNTQKTNRGDARADIHDGIAAYGAKQAHLFTHLAQVFAEKWYPLLMKNRITAEWPAEYIPVNVVLEEDEDEPGGSYDDDETLDMDD